MTAATTPQAMRSITLSTVNAKYMHASLGLRYLFTNLGGLQLQIRIVEFTINERAADIVERVLADEPRIVGLGVYIWNVGVTADVDRLIERIRPQTLAVLGGPEVSYEHERQEIVRWCDYVSPGAGPRPAAPRERGAAARRVRAADTTHQAPGTTCNGKPGYYL